MPYIELSDGRVGTVVDLENKRFKEDLKRLGLTYTITSPSHYTKHMILTTLAPEQVYYLMGGKKNFEY